MISRRTLIGTGAALLLARAARAGSSAPKLIVQITADQLRGDLLVRYRPWLTGGFKRLIDGGVWIRAGEVAHAITNSFPGHTTLASGLHPSRHGLTANEWWMETNGRWTWVDAAADRRHTLTGLPDRPGVSPWRMTGSTLADWIKAADPAAKSVALSTGSTVAMAYGGRKPDAVYWYDGQTGGFVTSTYYAASVAPWIVRFNGGGIQRYRRPVWELTAPADALKLARPDANPYENEGRNTTFPHAFAAESRPAAGGQTTPYGQWFAGTPLKDEALFALAAQAVDAERLGQRGALDYLAVLPDSTDSVGHNFGPNSVEQLDALLRLDRALGGFLDHLDRVLGPGGYLVGLSADHGVADPPEEHPGRRRVTTPQIEAVLDRVEALARGFRGGREELAEAIVVELRRADFIADAYSEARLSRPADDPFVELYQRSFRPGFTPDFPLWTHRSERPHHPARYGVVVRFKEGMIFDNATAVHGSPYAYDRLVPILVYGGGVPGGRALETGARTVDLAPTLAELGGLEAPAGLDGRSFTNLLR